MKQREAMRELWQRYADDPQRSEKVVRDYADMERAGGVARKSNASGLDAEDYASRLPNDGKGKGWL